MIDRIFYTAAAACVVAAAVLFSIVAYQYLKDQQAPVDRHYDFSDYDIIDRVGITVDPLHRETL